MIKNMLKITVISFFAFFYQLNALCDDELLVFKDTILFEKADKNSRKVMNLGLLEKIKLIKNDSFNGMLNVSSQSKKIGWIESKYTSNIPDDWISFHAEFFSLYFPSDFLYDSDSGSKLYQIYGKKNIGIEIDRSLRNFDEYIKSSSILTATGGRQDVRRYSFNNLEGYYRKVFYDEGLFSNNVFFGIDIKVNDNEFYICSIGVLKTKDFENDELIANKILCSFNLSSYKIVASVLNVREKPSAQSKVIGGIKKGEPFYLLQRTDVSETIEGKTAPWFRIKTIGGVEGYIFSGFLIKN